MTRRVFEKLCTKKFALIFWPLTEGGGFHTRVRGTMFVRNGAVTPGPSRECDILSSAPLLRDDQNLRDNRVTVQWRRAGCRVSPYRHPGCHANVVPPG